MVAYFWKDYGVDIDSFEYLWIWTALSIQEQIQLNYITKRDQLKKPKPVNKLKEEEEERIKEILYKIVKRADRNILNTLHSIFEKVSSIQLSIGRKMSKHTN